MNLLAESVVVGLLVLVIGTIVCNILKHVKSIAKSHNAAVTLFVTGFILHYFYDSTFVYIIQKL
jgi:ascorbate-specific PTS system EIIC-type component UlaA